MKNIIRYIIPVLLAFGATGCTEDPEMTPDQQQDGVCLTIRSAAPLTRTIDGIDELNENDINSLYYFFYPYDPDAPDADPLAQQPKYWGKFSDLNSHDEYILRINFTEYMLNYEVFPRPYTTCQVYVIANLPEDITIDGTTDKSLASLRQIVLTGDFMSKTVQDDFVMEGLGTATITNRKNIIAATGEILMDRVAAKISIGVTTVDSYSPTDEVYGSGKTWYPEPESMTVELVNGVSKAVLGAEPVDAQENDYFRTSSRNFNETSEDYWTAEPFYSYPAAWNVGDEDEPYLRIMLPWKTIINTGVGGEEPPIEDYQKCYYKLILGGNELARNTWYDMKVNIGVFGSFDEQEETILDVTNTTYYVADWTTGLEVDSEILGGRYLVVEKLKYEIYNEDTFEIPITSSHLPAITDISVTYPDLTNPENPKIDNTYEITISSDWSHIIVKNELDNNLYSDSFNFTPVTIKFTVFQDDNGNGILDTNEIYHKTIEITQYPAIYGVAQENSDYTNGDGNNADNGFVWVNGYQGAPISGVTNFGGAYGASSDDLTAVSMYVINISTLQGTDYIIGDPRTRDVDNLSKWNGNDIVWASAPALYDGENERTLKYYYPTDADLTLGEQDPTYNMISPKFRICSAYGAIANDQDNRRYYENVEGRCASYQEDGYPAGRWRLPTKAEFEFINTLSNKGLMPTLFVTTMDYWCAHGYGRYSNGSVTLIHNDYDYGSRSVSVRCVYDDWYWENVDQQYRRLEGNAKNEFTWGDMPRQE